MNISGIDLGLSEDIRMLRDTVQAFAAAEIAPRAAQIDKDNEFPADLWKKFGDLGLLGMTAHEDYGGSNMGYLAHIVAMEEISRASASSRRICATSASRLSNFSSPRRRETSVTVQTSP